MIIVSQDKTIIINFNNVSAIAIDDNNTKKQIHVRCNNDDDVIIGEYATEERTKEVLEKIIIKYKQGETSCMLDNDEWVNYKTVYEMPKE